jgi:hypothetical protein
LIFMHRMGDIGSGVVTPLLKKNFRLSADSPDIETFRRSHVQDLVTPLTTVLKTLPFTLLRTLCEKHPGGWGTPLRRMGSAQANIATEFVPSLPLYFITSLLPYVQKRRRPSRSDGAAAKRACRLQERRSCRWKIHLPGGGGGASVTPLNLCMCIPWLPIVTV